MNICAYSMICFPKNDPFFFLIVAQMVGWKLEQLEVEGHKPTQGELKMEVNLNC